MLRVLIELLPALIPLALYLLWHALRVRRCRKDGTCAPALREGPWGWMWLSCVLIAVVILFSIALTADADKGAYTPSHIEGGRVVPGTLEPGGHAPRPPRAP